MGNMDQEQYASGNRTNVGFSTNAMRIISSRAKKGQTSLEGIECKISNLRKEIRAEDYKRAERSSRVDQRSFFGFIQESSITEDSLRVIMLEEDTTRLYYNVAKCTVLYVDATGGLFQQIRDAGRVLYYAMVLGHPFNASAPVSS